MLGCRAVISSIEDARKKAESLGAVFNGEYSFKDIIFMPKKDDFNLSDDFLRMRIYSKTNWSSKNIVLVRKQTEFRSTGKIDNILLKKEFSTEKEALGFIENNLSSEFIRGFEFFRTGWQYQLKDCRIFIEDIEDFKPTIEIEAKNEEELDSLLNEFSIVEKINDSLPEIMRLFKL